MTIYTIIPRNGTQAAFAALNRIYAEGELLLEEQLDGTYKMKVGDGTTQYNTLPYLGGDAGGGNAFGTLAVPGQSSIVADTSSDVLTASFGAGLTATTNTTTDTISISPLFGSTSGTICQGDDSRLTNARTPLNHATNHTSGGGDQIKLDALAVPDDITALNATTSAHGLMPKLPNVAASYLNATGANGGWNRAYGVSVKDYGALGTDTGDDGPAWQAAIDAVPSGETLHVPPGTYRFASGVVIAKNIAIIGACQMAPLIHCVGGITVFTITSMGWGSRISGLQIYGDRTTASKGFYVEAGETFISDCRLLLLDVGIHVNGGNHQRFERIYSRNIKTTFCWFENGVGPTLAWSMYDTDVGSYAQPSYGVRINTEGVILSNIDIMHGGIGLIFEALNVRHIEWAMLDNLYIDSCTGYDGIVIRNNSTNGKYIRGLFFDHVWSASHVRGMLIDGSSADINGLVFSNCIFHNHQQEGVRITLGYNIFFDGCFFAGNSIAGDYPEIYTNASGQLEILNSQFGRFIRWATTPGYAIFIDTAQGAGVSIDGCFFDSSSYVNSVLFNASTSIVELGRNRNLATHTSGTAVIAAGATSATVTHGLYTQPEVHEVFLTPLGVSNAIKFWVDTFSATQFVIHCDQAPGGIGITIGWNAHIRAR